VKGSDGRFEPSMRIHQISATCGVLVAVVLVLVWPNSLISLTVALLGALVALWYAVRGLREFRRAHGRGRGQE
jgi:Flp pilus assembly protein TadB